ncbi:hypothetical protein GCM10010236_36500 [Streptomyces eurythermus]|nr:hypothetical protein GCM10010236_36500 [Streptomyces eurythermus]
MALRPVQVNIKALDSSAVGRFWAEALGWTAYHPGVTTYVGPAGGLVWPHPVAVCVDVVPVPEPKTATKNRVHLDLATTSTAHQTELVARLRALGAKPARVGQGAVPWTVLADPEGNEFCVLEPRETYRDTGPIARVVVDCADPRAMARFWGRGDGLGPARSDRRAGGVALRQGLSTPSRVRPHTRREDRAGPRPSRSAAVPR